MIQTGVCVIQVYEGVIQTGMCVRVCDTDRCVFDTGVCMRGCDTDRCVV